MDLRQSLSKGPRSLFRAAIELIDRVRLTPELIVRIRSVLLLIALLSLFLAFQVGDDWYVRTFANYDWARHIGY